MSALQQAVEVAERPRLAGRVAERQVPGGQSGRSKSPFSSRGLASVRQGVKVTRS